MGDLFVILTTKKKFNASDIQFGGKYRYIARGESNNGIKGYIDENPMYLNDANTISFGQDTATMFYQNEPYFTGDKIKVLKPKPKTVLNKNTAQVIITAMKKAFASFSWGSSSYSVSILKNIKIKLPITAEGSPDYTFMESLIAELEAERTAELEAYLKTTGLKDTHLTPEEQATLAQLETIQWGEFRLGDLFEHIKQGRRLKKSDQIKGNIPFVMAGTTNTGIANYIANPVASFPENAITIDIFGNAFYRSYPFGAGDDTGVYWNTSNQYTHKAMLFLTTAINKTLQGKFDYGRKLRSSKSLNYKIKLPITAEGTPDYTFMENFICALQKVVIADVVAYTDQKIQAHKTVIQTTGKTNEHLLCSSKKLPRENDDRH